MRSRLLPLGTLVSWWVLGLPWLGAAEMRTLEGAHIRVVTDLSINADRQQWTTCFDSAVPQWCAAWGVPAERAADFHITTYVMSDKEPFRARGWLPTGLPDFENGFQRGNRTWVLEQPSAYFTRHLILHEGVHALAAHLFGGAGPTWFMEGTAEWLGTHRWDGEHCRVGIVPEARDAVPYWGRFKVLSEARRTGEIPSLVTVLKYNPASIRRVETYAWSWVAVQLFAMDPETRPHLMAQAAAGRDRGAQFTRQFVGRLGDQWPLARARWRVLVSEFDYGFEPRRHRLELSVNDPPWDGAPRQLEIAAERGWQSAGVLLRPGQQVRIAAEGEATLADEPKPWLTFPPGVTVQYHRGQPLGSLVAALLPTAAGDEETTAPLELLPVGNAATLRAEQWCWLLLRINDVTGQLSDNAGGYRVRLR